MANRFPLVLDTADGNKIKEIPAGDNLDLRNTSIVDVQNINALGTINAAFVTVNGQQLVAQQFADLTDTPATYAGSEDFFVKVNAAGNGLEYRPLSDLGNIDIDTVTVTQDIIPAITNTGNVGTTDNQFSSVRANDLIGNLRSFNGVMVFDAVTGLISYGALQGAPEFLSEFEDDIGFLKTTDLDEALDGLFSDAAFVTDIQGSVFADDSTTLVDAVGGVIRGDTEYVGTGFIRGQNIVILADNTISLGETLITANINPDVDRTQSIGTVDSRFGNGYFATFNTEILEVESINNGLGLGIGIISSTTDIEINAGNRVKITGGVPFKFSSATATELLGVAGQNGDVIYNTTTNRLQMYQGGAWKDVNGNVEATSGTSNFNDVVVAGDLTVQGTTTSIDTTNTTITDNVIVLNNGEVGAGVTASTSGIEIDRGSEANKTLVWDDSVDKWTVGAETFVAATFEGDLAGDVTATDVQINGATSRITFNSLTAPEIRNTDGTVKVVMFGEDYSPGTAQLFVEANDVWLYSDLLVEQNTVVKGNVTAAAFKGTFVGDDSTILVDGVAGKIVGNVETTFGTFTNGLTVENIYASNEVGVNIGAGGYNNLVVTSGKVTVQNVYLNAEAGIEFGSATGYFTEVAEDGNLYIKGSSTDGDIIVRTNASGLGQYDFIFGKDGSLTLPGTVSGDLIGNIDNTTLTIGTTDATTIEIGNATSTTTVVGNFTLPDALIVGEITADDSISITTATGDGNAISIGPQGTNTFVNLTADNIRFYGPVVTEIDASAGVKGSVTGSDATLLVDAVNSIIPSANVSGTEATNWNTAYGWGDHSTEGYLTAIPGTYVQQGEQFVGDLTGTVFGDDSSVMVDAVNYAFIGDTMTLNVLTIEPAEPVNGMMAIADGTTWDPTLSGVNTLVVYLNGWKQIQTA